MKGSKRWLRRGGDKEGLSGGMTTGQTAARLGVSKQYVNRLKKAYSERDTAFRHGNSGKTPKWKTLPEAERPRTAEIRPP